MKPRYRPHIEWLEQRTVPATFRFETGIYWYEAGDDVANNVTIARSDNMGVVFIRDSAEQINWHDETNPPLGWTRSADGHQISIQIANLPQNADLTFDFKLKDRNDTFNGVTFDKILRVQGGEGDDSITGGNAADDLNGGFT